MSLHTFGARNVVAVLGAWVVLAACSSSAGTEATPNPNGKNDGAECSVGYDCKSGLCTDNTCAPSAGGSASSPNDGIKNGDESDVDCGGSKASKCADGKACKAGGDCVSGACTGGICKAPAPDDGIKNADETDVDCGGAHAPKCATGKGCGKNDDCTSEACSYAKQCVEFKGCTGHAGGDTCGSGETGEADAKHESCCTAIKVDDRPAGQGGPFMMDKYHVTAGRMRAFVERYDGNLKAWAESNPKGWNSAWNDELPGSMEEALAALGPNGKRGCNVTNQGGRTFWQGAIDGNDAEKSDFSKEVLDEKTLNCVTWYMAQAVCAFDGGRLASASEIQWVFENRGRGTATTYPWQFQDNAAYNPNNQDDRIVHQYSYGTPKPPTDMRTVNGQYPLDHAFYIAPPGRRPAGANMHGIMDVAGNVLTWVNDRNKNFSWTMSWEKHNKDLRATAWNATDGPDGYYAIGARCVRPL